MAQQSLVKKQGSGLQALIEKDSVKKRFDEVLGKRANQFASSLISIVNSSEMLAKADPQSVLTSAMKAAVLDLPIDPNLGFAYIVPFNNTKANKVEAQFQLGFKGFIQLALRTGEYKNINCVDIREGEIKKIDFLRDEYEIEFIQSGERTDRKIVGYAGYFKLMNGFEKTVYWPEAELIAHAKKYSQTFKKYGTGLWKDNFDGMAKKTVIKSMLSKWGILSIDFQKSKLAEAIEADQAVIGEDLTPIEYPDNPKEEVEAPVVVVEDDGDPFQ